MRMEIRSPAFASKTRIPDRYTCDGADCSPPLSWTGIPAAAKSLVVLCDDPDAPGGIWHHWAAFDIPPTLTSLPEDFANAPVASVHQADNDFGRSGYGGPCPPPGHGVHHYRFRLIALGVPRLGLRSGASCRQVELAARRHAIAEAELIGMYSR